MAERQSRPVPAANTIVSASTASTTQARNTAKNRAPLLIVTPTSVHLHPRRRAEHDSHSSSMTTLRVGRYPARNVPSGSSAERPLGRWMLGADGPNAAGGPPPAGSRHVPSQARDRTGGGLLDLRRASAPTEVFADPHCMTLPGERPGETDREQSRHRAPGRLNHGDCVHHEDVLSRPRLAHRGMSRRVPKPPSPGRYSHVSFEGPREGELRGWVGVSGVLWFHSSVRRYPGMARGGMT